jgi:hypothetical protein
VNWSVVGSIDNEKLPSQGISKKRRS